MKQTAAFIIIFMALTILAKGQNTLYFMDCLPQNRSMNPAMVPGEKFYLGLPGIGGVKAHAYNSGFNLTQFEDFYDNLGMANYNPDEFVRSIGETNHTFAEGEVNLLAMGIKLNGKNYLSFDASMKNSSEIAVASDVVYLLADLDDISSEDFPIIVDGIDLLTNTYLSLGASFSRKITEQFTIGISPRINFNLLGINTRDISYKIDEEIGPGGEKEYDQTFSGEVFLGLPTELNPEAIDGNELDVEQGFLPDNWLDDARISDLFRNKSFSIDLGATYELDQWLFSASLLNLGASKWVTNGYRLRGSGDVVTIENNRSVRMGIPAKLFIGAQNQFATKWDYAVLFRSDFYKGRSNASATVSLNGDIGRILSTSFSYTAGYKFNNIGMGLRLRFFPGADLFLVTDNLIQWAKFQQGHRLSAALGVNLSFGAQSQFR